ncbi:MAG: hypothetical protein ACRD21_29635 [Vicinamibacteria bacterium]
MEVPPEDSGDRFPHHEGIAFGLEAVRCGRANAIDALAGGGPFDGANACIGSGEEDRLGKTEIARRGEPHLTLEVDTSISAAVENRDDEADDLPEPGGRGKREDETGGLSRKDVDFGRVGKDGAYAVSVPVDRDPDALVPLGEAVASRSIADEDALAFLELPSADVNREDAGQRSGLELDARDIGRDLGVAGSFGNLGLR